MIVDRLMPAKLGDQPKGGGQVNAELAFIALIRGGFQTRSFDNPPGMLGLREAGRRLKHVDAIFGQVLGKISGSAAASEPAITI